MGPVARIQEIPQVTWHGQKKKKKDWSGQRRLTGEDGLEVGLK